MSMNIRTIDSLPSIIIQLQQRRLTDINAFLGFDACIDNIVRVVKDKKDNSDTGFYTTSRQFGEFLVDRDNSSCGVELETKLSKPGGNMVIMGNALGKLGINVDCVGTFGLPEILPVFRSISENCKLHTVGDTITATALEFNNSKVILFDPGPYNKLNWKVIKDLLGIEKIIQLFSGKQLISFLNWSEIENSSIIWKGVLDEILPSVKQTEVRPFFFTDFSDCSRRPKHEIRYAIELLAGFRNHFKVIVSLNRNEADLVAAALDLPESSSDEAFIKSLFEAGNTDVLLIHRTNDALGYDGSAIEKCETFFCSEPSILTGGGDNFNAGFCFSLFQDFNLFESLVIANAVSGSYVKTGISPDINILIDYLLQNSKNINPA
jgi:hypothetical protein